ncbi:cytochrome P450 [Dichomitus squalens LYAD-421 SS1]|uniref:Cytochrome P450 n=1 Tax=Dichomitus squalens (strain LYAD-421) TaxID=732165 RepID=R7SK31_DICSQ|nr:cytochrome P450 [Dichomitus squalens LYAD-421 SS1]EJF55407.1 cytochrome P450 [Dichomitus squalens LYAD-421 SS1]
MIFSLSLVASSGLAALAILLIFLYRSASSVPGPLPPGPPPLPLVGNIFRIPKIAPWVGYQELSRQYGKIMSLKAFGQTFIVVDDADIAMDLLEKRSAIYSSRPESNMVALVGWDWNFGMFPYGAQWRRYRRMFWQHFHTGVVSKHDPHVKRGAAILLRRLLQSKPDPCEDIRHSLAAVVLGMTYGIRIAEKNDKYLAIIEGGSATGEHLITATSILEFLPVLARLPTWLPGASFLRTLQRCRKAVREMRFVPWNDTKHGIMDGVYDASNIAAEMREELSRLTAESVAEEEAVALDIAATVYSGETTQLISLTFSTLCGFFLAMSLYPNVQRKAQAELDAVVGPGRLPELEDLDQLPYVNAIIKEALRWHHPTPLAVPHTSTSDGEYSGYFIPKGSAVIVNIWSILHNPEYYPRPDEFVPERFMKDGNLDAAVRDPSTVAFGFGRRVCPGRHLADNMLFIYISSVLHTYNITPPLDKHGQPIHIQPRGKSGIVSYLEDVRCTIKPRSASAEALIRTCADGLLETRPY